MPTITAILSIGDPSWLVPSLAILVGVGLLAAWAYAKSGAGSSAFGLWSLRALGVLAVVLCLIEPNQSSQRPVAGANDFVVALDTAERLQTRDRPGGVLRSDTARDLFAAVAPWRQSIEERFTIRNFGLDTQLSPLDPRAPAKFDGMGTRLGFGLDRIQSFYNDRPLSGVLWITDGVVSDAELAAIDTDTLPPIFPVIVGQSDALEDIALTQVSITESSFEKAPFRVRLTARRFGRASDPIVAEIVDPMGKVVETQTEAKLDRDGRVRFLFDIQPEGIGPQFYQARVFGAESRDAFLAGEDVSEATSANNTRFFTLNRRAEPFRVLYVTGRPNWEFKFIKRGLEEDPQISLVALVRVATREPKFDFKGREGEDTNPFYRGFDKTDETTEEYDEPVIKRLFVRDRDELLTGFPTEIADLFEYDALILDDVEADFFKPSQATMVQRFVTDRGAGLAMLGGMESFNRGGYDRTPIGAALPVYMDRRLTSNDGALYRWELTREGWLEPWARLRATRDAEIGRLANMEPFQVLNKVRDVKPGALTIATVVDEGGDTFPALVTQRVGFGRSAALTVGDMWRSGLGDPDRMEDLYQFWRQLTRWLVNDAPRRLNVTTSTDPEDPAKIRIGLRVLDEAFLPDADARARFQIEPIHFDVGAAPAEEPIRLSATPSEDEIGVYQSSFRSEAQGAFRVTAIAEDSNGIETGREESGFILEPFSDPFQTLLPNTDGLTRLAEQTGGKALTPSSLDSFAADVDRIDAPVMETVTASIWHTPWWLAFAILCFVIEWGLRRQRGLP